MIAAQDWYLHYIDPGREQSVCLLSFLLLYGRIDRWQNGRVCSPRDLARNSNLFLAHVSDNWWVVCTISLFLAVIEIRDRNQGTRVRLRTRGCNDWTTRMTVHDICRLPKRLRRFAREQRGGFARSWLGKKDRGC